MKISRILLPLAVFSVCCMAGATAVASGRPALVVNIVAGGVPYDFVTRYGHNLSDDGIRRFMDKGLVFTAGRYEYMPTNQASSLATITTGTYPYVHGVVGSEWYDIQSGRRVSLIDDPQASGLDCEYEEERYSYVNLVAPTLGDRLRKEVPRSKVVTVAADPLSAVTLGGFGSQVYWFDTARASWVSSSKYMLYLPGWVVNFNAQYKNNTYLHDWFWAPHLLSGDYVNRRCEVLRPHGDESFRTLEDIGDCEAVVAPGRYEHVLATPLIDDLVSDFVQQAVVQEKLGTDEYPDLLNVCFDGMRKVIRRYGPESVEAEDMFYHLDRTLASLMRFVESQCPEGSVLFVFTSDHGTSEAFDVPAIARERFNDVQFEAIINSFLCARYGGDRWVTGYHNRRVYIDRAKALAEGLDIENVQRLTSDFAIQFRGLSRVVPSCDLKGGSAGDSYMQKLRNGYYPKRSGDLLVDLVPDMIEEEPGVRSMTGSGYDYDTHVPLMMTGCGIAHGEITAPVDMASLPVTLAYILGIQRPDAATAEPFDGIYEYLK